MERLIYTLYAEEPYNKTKRGWIHLILIKNPFEKDDIPAERLCSANSVKLSTLAAEQ